MDISVALFRKGIIRLYIKIALILCALLSSNTFSNTLSEYAIVLPSKSNKIVELAKSLQSQIPSKFKGNIISSEEISEYANLDLYITIGGKSFQQASKQTFDNKSPGIIGAFLKSTIYEQHKTENSTAVFNNSKPSLQIPLATNVFRRKALQVALLYSHKSEDYILELLKLNESLPLEQRLNFHTLRLEANDNTQKALSDLDSKHQLDALIIQPDNLVFRRDNLKSIFYTLYKNKIGALVYTPGLVKKGAGGLASVYYDDHDVIDTTAKFANNYLTNNTMMEASHPVNASVRLNKRLARSLGIQALEEREIEEVINER